MTGSDNKRFACELKLKVSYRLLKDGNHVSSLFIFLSSRRDGAGSLNGKDIDLELQ